MIRCGLIAVIALSLGAIARAEGGSEASGRRSFLSHRVVKQFDFDERDDGNFERLPRYWFVVRAAGYPRHTADQTAFDDAFATSGKYSLRMKSDGGSAAVILQKGAIAAIPGADYVVSAMVRTAGANHARARLVGYFLDDSGRAIAASRDSSPLLTSEDRWQQVQVRLGGDHPDAAWIILRLELLQADQYRPARLGHHELYPQDIDVTAWFDDVVIFQLPRIELTTQSVTGVIRQPQKPTLDLEVRDLTGDRLTAELEVYDHAGQRVDAQSRAFDGRQSPSWRWTPRIEQLGWYWVDLRVSGPQGLVGRRAAAFLWLPELSSRGRAEAGRLGVISERDSTELRRLLPEMVSALGVDGVVTDVWRQSTTMDELKSIEQGPDEVIARLLNDRRKLTLSLSGVPVELAAIAGVDADKPMSLFDKAPETWLPILRSTLVRYGQNVNRWQIGRTGSDEAFWNESLGSWHAKAVARFSSLVPQAELVVPWSVQQEDPVIEPLPMLSMNVPVSVMPEHLGAYLNTTDIAGRTVVLESLDPQQFDHTQRVQDMTLRLIEAWRAGPGEIYLRQPWNQAPARQTTALPDPLAGVLANMVYLLGERRVVGPMDVASGVRCYILDGPAGGALVIWTHGAQASEVDLDLFLGDKPERIDVWGNRSPLEVRDGRHRLAVGRQPVFVEGIDAKLARFRAGLVLKPDFVESSFKQHAIELQITNPWPMSVSGRVRLEGLDRWTINPRSVQLDIPAGKTISLPVDVSFPVSELAGEKHITALMQLQADRSYELSMNLRLTLGLRDIDYHPTLSVHKTEQGDDLVISALVTNRGQEPRTLYAFANAPNHPRLQRLIVRLAPGESTLRQFRLVGAAGELSGQQVRVGLRELDGTAMINQLLPVP